MKKVYLLFISSFFACFVLGQQDSLSKVEETPLKRDSLDVFKKDGTDFDFERPFNFFASAGVAFRFGNAYNISVSPINYQIQFDRVSPLTSGFSLGLVWNPFPDFENAKRIITFKNEKLNESYRIARKHAAVVLLVNVFQLSYTSSQFNSAAPIDVGFGAGYRNENFLALFTIEFMKTNQPRKYFVDEYKGANKQLVLAGSQEPVRVVSPEDNSLFITKLYPAIGFKVAYSFSKKSEN